MLSRVADTLYWMSRYLERAEYTARLIDVNLNLMLDQSAEAQATNARWERLLASLHMPPLEQKTFDAYSITQSLTFDLANNSSIVSCIATARENARQVREQISSEMWEQLNRLYLAVKQTHMDEIWYAGPNKFLASIKEGVHLFQGITDATMSHSQGWHFLRVGRFLERAIATATRLDIHFSGPMEIEPSPTTVSLDYLDWVGLLRSCAAFDAYCKVYTGTFQPDKIAEFLLLNAEFPHSMRFSIATMQLALQAIAKATTMRSAGRAERLAGRLRAALDYDQIEEIMNGNIHSYLENIQHQCSQIHAAIYEVYVTYPIDVALTSRGASQA